MPRVLLITYFYPPLQRIGAVRPMGLKKYLPRFGWECMVLTPRLEGAHRNDPDVIETEYVDVIAEWKRRLHLNPKKTMHAQLNLPLTSKPNSKRLHTLLLEQLRGLLSYPDKNKGWVRFACDHLNQVGSLEFDAIVSSSPPISSHLIARRAKRLLHCPWVADFRDLWTQNLANPPSLLLPLERKLERNTLADADALVTVSDKWAERLASRYTHTPVHAISNGFDPDDFPGRPTRLTDLFSITYTGQLYEGRRDPSPLLHSIRELIDQGVLRDKICLRFYGPQEPWLRTLIGNLGLTGIVDTPGTISREEAIARQRESQILLLLGWHDARETGQHTGKLFEYLGSRRPILAINGAPGALSEVLAHTGAGEHVQSKTELKRYLTAAYREFKEIGSVRYHGKEDAISEYTHLEMARKFAEVLNGITEAAHPKTNYHQQHCCPSSS